MIFFDPRDIDYVSLVAVDRPVESYDAAGNAIEGYERIMDELPADIQLSLRVRSLTGKDERGMSDNRVWVMFCAPEEPICRGDRITDGDRELFVDAVGEWGSHVECVLRP